MVYNMAHRKRAKQIKRKEEKIYEKEWN
jgi:hypothetical protein